MRCDAPTSSSAPHGDGHQSLPIGFAACASAGCTPPTPPCAATPATSPATRPPWKKARRETPWSGDAVSDVCRSTVCAHGSSCWDEQYCLSHPDCMMCPPSQQSASQSGDTKYVVFRTHFVLG